ncbi:type II secretion system F family protein [Siminovitchia sediminis]|uniref:Type II secretion system F family protein n=1 Tax=Siminovitchia sediminis TaxID=1274353 RepID=A0ABW4KI40_9BACI
MILLNLSFFLTVSLFYLLLFSWGRRKREVIHRRVETYFYAVPAAGPYENLGDLPFYGRVIDPQWKKFKKRFQKKINHEETYKLETKLLQAGQPYGFSPVEFTLLQMLLKILLPALVIFVAILAGVSAMYIIIAAMIAFAAAHILPSYLLKVKTDQRNQSALKALPDTLDLLTISLEAGLGFDGALGKVVSRKKSILTQEFGICLEEMRLGKVRREALKGMNQRLSLEEMQSFIHSIIQAEKLGIGMVSVLRVQSGDMREHRRQRAEEKAMKAPIKMLFPLVLFIFPTLFIVLLGPAIIKFMESFS